MSSMENIPEIRTPRVLLRGWRGEDLDPFAAMSADPEVMRHFPATLSRAETAALIDRVQDHFARHGFGLWAAELPGEAPFAGFVGLAVPRFEAAFTPCVEVGWRLARPYWGRGYATEAARAALHHGFTVLGLEQIYSFTVPGNFRSRAVMERLGLRHYPDEDFDHPMLIEGHPLRRHVLYRIRREEFLELTAPAGA
jgi:RimJ/RimL family protein N-acetyltransferase